MIKSFLVGAVLGILGKKLYDNGRLDPAIAKLREKIDGLSLAKGEVSGKAGLPVTSKASG